MTSKIGWYKARVVIDRTVYKGGGKSLPSLAINSVFGNLEEAEKAKELLLEESQFYKKYKDTIEVSIMDLDEYVRHLTDDAYSRGMSYERCGYDDPWDA